MKRGLLLMVVMTFMAAGTMRAADDDITITIDRANHLSVGVKAGGNIIMPSGNKNQYGIEYSMGAGGQVGVLVNYHFGRRTMIDNGGTGKWALQIEGTYNIGSLKCNNGDAAKYNHIEAGGVIQFYPLKNVYVEAGAMFSVEIGDHEYEMKELNTKGEGYELSGIRIRPSFGNTVNPVLGVGYKFNNGLGVNLRYMLGTSLNESDAYVKKVSALQLSVSYTIDIIK
ncbi:MAG: hypothetical protein PUD91_02340 [Bacteroidales bacterium]|nr:hypothetical protein [Bacteroidales bacterium]